MPKVFRAPAADPAEDAVMGHRLPHGLRGRSHRLDMLGGDEGEVNCRVPSKVLRHVDRRRTPRLLT
jgi:hypothetical protein